MNGERMSTEPTRHDPSTKSSVVVIIGLPGVGKSTIGRRAARRLGWDFLDLDATIESRSGRTIREIFDAEGEEGFRRIESQTLRECLTSNGPCIVATGGGIVLREENRDALSGAAAVVWMTAGVDDLASRLAPRAGAGKGHRPLLDGDLGDNLRRLQTERSDLYAVVATDVVDTSGSSFDEVVEVMLETIASRVRSKRDANHATEHVGVGRDSAQECEG